MCIGDGLNRLPYIHTAINSIDNPGHKIPRTKYRTEITENRTEITETEIFGSYFGSEFSVTELPR